MDKVKKILGNPWGQRAIILVIIFVFMAIAQPVFFTGKNWASILLAIALYGIMACGMVFVVLIGNIDLCVGSTAAMGGALLTVNWVSSNYTTAGFVKGLVLGILSGIIIGLIHGVIVAYLKLPSFVVTIATQYLVYGLVVLYTKGAFFYPNKQDVDPFYAIGNSRFLGISSPVWIFVVVVIITAFVLSKTTYGRRLYAVGGSNRAAELVGINTKRHTIIAFTICAVCASLGGIVLVSMNMVAGCTTAQGYQGDVLMAVIVGGINLMGGEGGISGAVYGALFVGILNNLMILIGLPSDYYDTIQGIIIIAALALNVFTQRKAAGIISPRKAQKLAAKAAAEMEAKRAEAAKAMAADKAE